MNITIIAALAGTVFLLGSGSLLAETWPQVHDSLAPTSNGNPVTGQWTPTGADLRIPQANANFSIRGNAYDYQCADAKANGGGDSFEVATFCAPGDR